MHHIHAPPTVCSQMQNRWRGHVADVAKLCSREFWYVFRAVQDETVQCQDNVLSAVKTLLCEKQISCCGRKWPQCNRTLRQAADRQAGNFWDNVLRTKKICLHQFRIPGCDSVTFTYVDPIFVWIRHCNRLHAARQELQWRPKELRHPRTNEKLYGAGVQHGLVFRKACRDLPAGARVALINLSWDGGGTGYSSRSATPICVQVMNVNTSSVLAVGLVGYLPQLDVADSIKKAGGTAFKNATHHVLQVHHADKILLLCIRSYCIV